MKKLLLINPVGHKSGFLLSKSTTFPPLGLGYVAALTPDHWQIKIIDENFDNFQFEEADLVGITAFTSNINRAYEIAGIYKEKKIKVVIGGIHASMLPDEALRFADAVVIGEAENIWKKVIDDFESNSLQQKYQGSVVDLTKLDIIPRRDLFNPNYFWETIQTSRGCPLNCNFCSVSRYLGKQYRQRKAEDILKELDELKGKYIFFVDDNLVGYGRQSYQHAKVLFRGMIERSLNKKWLMQTSINAAEDEELIKLAADAGCMFVFIGFETIKHDSLLEYKKGVNLKVGADNYKKVVDIFHKYGIGVLGAFIIGSDYETPEYYKIFSDYLIKSGIDIFQISLLTPIPGTDFIEQLKRENRLPYTNYPSDWDKYRFSYIVHDVKGPAPELIYTASNHIKNKLYSFPNYQIRMLKSLFKIRKTINWFAIYKINEGYKKAWKNSHYFLNYPHVLP
ncbi:MAG TPA: radical SAM protein [Smithella sp.]|nr:radical SAM protein [Smithella sp.]